MTQAHLSSIIDDISGTRIGSAFPAGDQGIHIVLRPHESGFGMEFVFPDADMRTVYRRIASGLRHHRNLRHLSMAQGDVDAAKAMQKAEDVLEKLQGILIKNRRDPK